MSITRPVKNAGEKYINGLNLTWTSGTVVAASAGICRDSTNTNDMNVSEALELNTALSGAGGLDTGTIANSTLYAVYLIDSSYGKAVESLIMSANHSAPVMPYNYDMQRRIGFVLTNSNGTILAFYQVGNGSDRWMKYDVSVATDITAGASATFAEVDCTASVPLINTIIDLDCEFDPTAANDELVIVPNGSASPNGVDRMSGSAAGVTKIGHLHCPCQSDATLEYKVTGDAVALNVQGYLDTL